MLPAHLAENIRKQVLYYLQSTFDFSNRSTNEAFLRFLEDPEGGIFKGPWAQLRRPYRPAPAGATIPLDLAKPFHPFIHQLKAWQRLSTKDGHIPEHTIVTTGTGSGKTECFLFPILDHCLRARKAGQKGIKAIVLYPMNALASDQERRFAEAIWKDPHLKGAGIRVGNYTGRYDPSDPGAGKESGDREMGEKHGITHHGAQQENPPDILLTNYKMLDFLLMRPQDQNLWRFNEPGVLRYLVLDELHTYDGAQGSDVACLIRRLKERLAIPSGGFCVVGTSATLDSRSTVTDTSGGAGAGGGADTVETGQDRLAVFSGKLFEEDIPTEAVIVEDRLTVEEIVHPDALDLPLPSPASCLPSEGDSAESYAWRQAELWGGPVYSCPEGADEQEQARAEELWALVLGDWLKRVRLFRYLLEIAGRAEANRKDPLSWQEFRDQVAACELGLAPLSADDRTAILGSFFSLIASAMELRGGKAFPLVPTQIQIWIRELTRVGRTTEAAPRFTWLDEPIPGQRCLPAFHCSECGESGWIGLHDPQKDALIGSRGVTGIQLLDSPRKIYEGWFTGGRDWKAPAIVVLSPWNERDEQLERQGKLEFAKDWLCTASLVLRKGDGPCPLTGDSERIRVKVNRETRATDRHGVVGDQGCPCCGSKVGVMFIGCQSATLSSLVIDEMFGSALNSDPKLLAFTDSVQDASHRAGFFTARTYNFTFRTALQHLVDDAGPGGIRFTDIPDRLLGYWSQPKPRLGSVKESLAVLLPADLKDYSPWLGFRNNKQQEQPPTTLLQELSTRIGWEATREFSLMQTHGRTMEPSGCSSLGWDSGIIADTVNRLRERLPVVSPTIAAVDDELLKLWIFGILHRYRERGALGHSYLGDLARRGAWGKKLFGRAAAERETYPPAIRYRPRLITTHSQKGHEYLLSPTSGGNLAPWHLVWSRRALKAPAVAEAELLDALRLLLNAGAASGLFERLHQDGGKEWYAVSAQAAVLFPGGVLLQCSETGRQIVRPPEEARVWEMSPSLEYFAELGIYTRQSFSPRQKYYQDRYRKGALRRVVASEHTGLLATDEREGLEQRFKKMEHADDPNILTCTSTLEMGIDIGDLSSTLLCSIPPSTASYLQRIGRAGRSTGTALIVSVINQRPHDLFFFARPLEMLKGRVDPPGCWLDASAVLVRQYLGYGIDCSVKMGRLAELPRSGRDLVRDMQAPGGNLPRMFEWITENEAELRRDFLNRFHGYLQEDTKERFYAETGSDLLLQRVHQVANEFDRFARDLENARKRLQDQLKSLDPTEVEARREIEQELTLLKGRIAGLGKVSALELLTDHGLLPNYAFPERGVRFYGAVYNSYRNGSQEIKPIELSRPAGAAIKELAPSNYFYTHSRQFQIQQIAIGNQQQPLTERWAICGACGHMRLHKDMQEPGAAASCPQCGHDGDQASQADQGQQRLFLEFPRSQAVSFMEQYESMSADKSDERQREFYRVIRSFDQTMEAPVGAVGDDLLPFGIEYRSVMVLREVNVGYHSEPVALPFGPDQSAPENGFLVCRDCGVVVPGNGNRDDAAHRRSCSARRKAEKLRQEGRSGDPYQWESVYIYRELRSEALRLLLPLADDSDVDTLTAALYLGLRLRFEGNPAHLIVTPQIVPEPGNGLQKRYLVAMDAVPGGTGYLKTLYQQKDASGRDGEGIIEVLRLALDTLETCSCRKLDRQQHDEDTDGCYRCIRSYHLQYNAGRISRERGITLLRQLLEAGARREPKQALADIKADALFGSVLEKKFVEALMEHVELRRGTWDKTIIKGSQGFRFTLPGSPRLWELELQPRLGPAHGVDVPSQPDFLLSVDDESVKPVAIFTDGFEYHCHPVNRIADDLKKRRSIIASGAYHVWSITWDDLSLQTSDHVMVCDQVVKQLLEAFTANARIGGMQVPDGRLLVRNGLEQLKAFLETPDERGWTTVAHLAAGCMLPQISKARCTGYMELSSALTAWRGGSAMKAIPPDVMGEWVYNDKVSLTQDIVSCSRAEDLAMNRKESVHLFARLGDSEAEVSGSDYRERWRRFLACCNLYQFSPKSVLWSASEVLSGTAPELPLEATFSLTPEWEQVAGFVVAPLKRVVLALAGAGIPMPQTEYYRQDDSDEYAELAWPERGRPVAVLAGDQEQFSGLWQAAGWQIVTATDVKNYGAQPLLDLLSITS